MQIVKMFSILRPSLVYKDLSPDVTEHDEDWDAGEWQYDGKIVFRGTRDPTYAEYNLDVYSLYDENSRRIGFAEHDSENHAEYRSLWFYECPYATLLQEPDWKTESKTLWSMMTSEAYQDCTELSLEQIVLKSRGRIILPSYMVTGLPEFYECSICGLQSFSPLTKCKEVKKMPIQVASLFYFMDESYILYRPPETSKCWIKLGLPQPDASPLQALHQQEVVTPLEEEQLPLEILEEQLENSLSQEDLPLHS